MHGLSTANAEGGVYSAMGEQPALAAEKGGGRGDYPGAGPDPAEG